MTTGAAEQTIETAELCSGFGQFHSPNNKIGARNFVTVTMASIERMMADPPCVEKSEGQWVIFSTRLSRVHKEQREQGQFHALWSDIDRMGGNTFDDTVTFLECFLPCFLAHTSRSATEANQKMRVIIPLAQPVRGERYVILQKILNDTLQTAGIEPDRKTEAAGQICYLPNRGEFYRYHIQPGRMDPDAWRVEEERERGRMRAEREARARQREDSRRKAAERMRNGCQSPIDAYNDAHPVEATLADYGYEEIGSRWLSPNSASGAPGVVVTADGRKWLSAHASDAKIGRPTANGTMGDAFDLFVHFEHGGDRNAAIKAAAKMFGIEHDDAWAAEGADNQSAAGGGDLLSVLYEAKDFCLIEVPPKRIYLDPWIDEGSIVLISGARNIGKSFFAQQAAGALTAEEPFGPWSGVDAVPTAFIDAEMLVQDLQERARGLRLTSNRKAPLYLLADAQAHQRGLPRFRLTDPAWRDSVKKLLLDRYIKVLFLDNLASLCPGIDENAKKEWDPINQWLLELRFAGIAAIMLHHLGKNGAQRGTSGREDNITTAIELRPPRGYQTTDGAKFITHFSKNRVPQSKLHLLADIELQLMTDADGSYSWRWGNVNTQNKTEVLRLLGEGVAQRDVAGLVGISPGQVSKTRKRWISEGYLTEKNNLTQDGKIALSNGNFMET